MKPSTIRMAIQLNIVPSALTEADREWGRAEIAKLKKNASKRKGGMARSKKRVYSTVMGAK